MCRAKQKRALGVLTQENIAPGKAIFAQCGVKRACGPKAWPEFCREAAKPHGVLEQSTELFVALPPHILTTTKGSAVLFIKCRRMPASRHCRRQSARIFLALHQKLPFQGCFAVLRSPQAAKAPVGPLSKLSSRASDGGNAFCRQGHGPAVLDAWCVKKAWQSVRIAKLFECIRRQNCQPKPTFSYANAPLGPLLFIKGKTPGAG